MSYALIIFILSCIASPVLAQSHYSKPGEPLDYQTLSHTLSIELFRAGSHDASGSNAYYFQATLIGLLNSSEERNLPLEKRKKIELDLGVFGDTNLDALSIWRPDEKNNDTKTIAIDGAKMRVLIARIMSEMKVPESDVAAMVTISLFEKEKQFGFFGKDQLIAQASFYPLPPPLFESLFRTNTMLQMQDAKGLDVKIAVRFNDVAEGTQSRTETEPKNSRSTGTGVSSRTSSN